MTRALVLGAGGGIGSMAARTLVTAGELQEVVLADIDETAVARVWARWREASTPTSIVAIDVADSEGVAGLLSGVDLVVNCVGPFYRYGPPLLAAAIQAGVGYVDVCDDLAPTRTMLDRDAEARAAGVCALVGMGNSPGLANVLVRYCADHLLDAVTSVDIMHIHGGEPVEGAAVLKHRIHAMVSDVPVFADGEFRTVRMLEPSGQEFVADVTFRDVGTYPVHPYPHPETITLPRHLPGVQRVTNRGVVFPLSYFSLTQDLVRAGLGTTDVVRVAGHDVVAVDFAVAHLIAQRPRLLREAGVTGPAGCLRIDVSGTKDGAQHSFVFSLSSSGAGAAEGTGIPAALGALLLARGRISEPGVHAPEAVVDPLEMLGLAAQLLPRLEVAGTSGSLPIHVAHVGPDGTTDELALAL